MDINGILLKKKNINVLCNMSYYCLLMKIFKRLVNDLFFNPAFIILYFLGQNGCLLSLFRCLLSLFGLI
jgi:hypothetical protein